MSLDYDTAEAFIACDVYANAIAFGIQHPDTRPLLTIGIKAPWGAGKTSLMRMVRRRLEWPQTWCDLPDELPGLKLIGAGAPSDRPVKYRELLRELRRAGKDSDVLTATPEPGRSCPCRIERADGVYEAVLNRALSASRARTTSLHSGAGGGATLCSTRVPVATCALTWGDRRGRTVPPDDQEPAPSGSRRPRGVHEPSLQGPRTR